MGCLRLVIVRINKTEIYTMLIKIQGVYLFLDSLLILLRSEIIH